MSWFLSDLNEFAAEAKTFLRGVAGGDDTDGTGAADPTRDDESATDEEAVEGSEREGSASAARTDRDGTVLAGYDANGVPIFVSTASPLGRKFKAAQQGPEEGDSLGEDAEVCEEDGGRARLLAYRRRMRAEVEQLRAREAQLQAIVVAQQQRIAALEAELVAAPRPHEAEGGGTSPAASRAAAPPADFGDWGTGPTTAAPPTQCPTTRDTTDAHEPPQPASVCADNSSDTASGGGGLDRFHPGPAHQHRRQSSSDEARAAQVRSIHDTPDAHTEDDDWTKLTQSSH